MQVMRVQDTDVQEPANYNILRRACAGPRAVKTAGHINPARFALHSLQRTALQPRLQDMLLQRKRGF